jgi:hypothetical protein
VLDNVNNGDTDTPVAPEAGLDSDGVVGVEFVVKLWIEDALLSVLEPPESIA